MPAARPHRDLARSQFEEDMARAGSGDLVRRHGWVLEPDYAGLRLRARMWSVDEQARRRDDYHLDLDMSYYRRHPPGVTFVNPDTRSFDPRNDMRWLPAIASVPPHIGIAYHPKYSLDNGVTKQMVCNSMVLEYYQTAHSPRDEEAWDPERHTLFATLTVLQTMLTAPYYGGRSA